jgi:hypothetical protein
MSSNKLSDNPKRQISQTITAMMGCENEYWVSVSTYRHCKTSHSGTDSYYNMNHGKRGKAIIISHKYFLGDEKLTRKGTEVDEESLVKAFQKLGFELEDITLYKDRFDDKKQKIPDAKPIIGREKVIQKELKISVVNEIFDTGIFSLSNISYLFLIDRLFPVEHLVLIPKSRNFLGDVAIEKSRGVGQESQME